VERECEGLELKDQGGFRAKMRAALRVMRVFLWGLKISALSGLALMALREPHSRWFITLSISFIFLITLDLFRKDEPDATVLLWYALCLCLIPVFYLRAHDWAPVVLGVLFAAYFLARSKATGRPYRFMLVGSLIAGVLSLKSPWPNEQLCLLTLVGVGLTATLQGAWIILRYLQGDRPAEILEPNGSSSKSSDRALLRIIHAIFGTIEHVQIYSPEVEQRIRTRYQSEISQLTDLGFGYVFSGGEAFSLFRLALILPAIIVVQMRCKGEVMTLHEGSKLMAGYPVLISTGKTAFAEVSGLGVKFYTTFQDGFLLVSKDYADDDIPVGPMIVKYAQKASISDTWAAHQKQIEAMEADGKRVDCQTSFPAYAEMSHKETAAW
jgi:hypothetical protein